ncbi:MAG: hypothetical protein Kow0059_21280 [Candidatus Sumerlaeia bacterium]
MRRFSCQAYPHDTRLWLVQVPPAEIGYINSLMEGYEGLALVRTRDEKRGLIELIFTPEQQPALEQFLEALERELPLRRLEAGSNA